MINFISFKLKKESNLVKTHYDNAVSEMESAIQNIKAKERNMEFSHSSKKKIVQNHNENALSDSQKKVVVHVPEKETRVLRDVSIENNNEKILTEIQDLEKKYSSMHSKLEELNVDEDETLFVRKDLTEMNNLMQEFEHKKMALHKQKFQTFIHKLLKKFHHKKKKLLLEIDELKRLLDNAVASNKEYQVKIEFLQTSYQKLLVEFEDLQEIKRSLEEDIAKYQKNEIVLRSELEKIKALYTSLQRENHFLHEKNESLEMEKGHLIDENRKFLAKLTKYESENALYRLEIEKLKEMYTDKITDLKKEIVELQKNNKTLVDEIAELKKDNVLMRGENHELTKEKERMKEEIRELEFLLKEKVNEINHLRMLLERSENRPPCQMVTEIPVEKRIEVPIEKIVEKVVEVPVERVVERVVEVPVERVVYVENNELIHSLEAENNKILEEMNFWKEKCYHLEQRDLKGLIQENSVLMEKTREGEGFICELKEKINMMQSEIYRVYAVNQEKNLGLRQYIEGLVNQNQYLESFIVNR